ncbi:molybdenum cofactor guanylyltransferase [Methanobacterium oryzae]|uniref:molybdenum cofactor guanylyltransferase n=1 Tax=Methanobacterium oryzae TaxID=69540 RepID=UPI003D20495C
MKSVIILCGGRSKRMGKDKGSLLLNDKPMVLHVLDAIKNIADEIILVLRDTEQIESYNTILNHRNMSLKAVADETKDGGPLIGILTGLSYINSDYAQILPCDSPFISKDFVVKMFELAKTDDFDAIVPVWNDGHIEPLHSLYKKSTIETIEKLISKEKRNVSSLIENLNAKYVPVEILDKTNMSFQNINTIKDFKDI